VVGKEHKFGKHGRRPGALDLSEETKKDFLELGEGAWEYMEDLREEWEEKLDKARALFKQE
jgi:hypothetical protein